MHVLCGAVLRWLLRQAGAHRHELMLAGLGPLPLGCCCVGWAIGLSEADRNSRGEEGRAKQGQARGCEGEAEGGNIGGEGAAGGTGEEGIGEEAEEGEEGEEEGGGEEGARPRMRRSPKPRTMTEHAYHDTTSGGLGKGRAAGGGGVTHLWTSSGRGAGDSAGMALQQHHQGIQTATAKDHPAHTSRLKKLQRTTQKGKAYETRERRHLIAGQQHHR